jgi:hypothetical protein
MMKTLDEKPYIQIMDDNFSTWMKINQTDQRQV